MKLILTENQIKFLNQIILSEHERLEFLKGKFVGQNLDEETFNKLVEIDPTHNKKYTMWIIKEYLKLNGGDGGHNLFWEDAYKLTEDLELLSRIGAKFPNNDINQYSSIRELASAAIAVTKSITPDELVSGKNKDNKWNEFKIGDVDGYSVYEIPKDRIDLYWLSKELGTRTRWCTAADSEAGKAHFINYINKGSLYIFINNSGSSSPNMPQKAQFSYAANQFVDEEDASIFTSKYMDNIDVKQDNA